MQTIALTALSALLLHSSLAYDLTQGVGVGVTQTAAKLTAIGSPTGQLNPSANDVLFGATFEDGVETSDGWSFNANQIVCTQCAITSGLFGNAVRSGSSPMVVTSSQLNAYNGNALSFSFWFRIGEPGDAVLRAQMALINHAHADSWSESNLKVIAQVDQVTQTLGVTAWVRDSAKPDDFIIVGSRTKVPLRQLVGAQWHHFVLSIGVDSMALYWDGVQLGVRDGRGIVNIGNARGKTNKPIAIAGGSTTVDDFAIWSKSLSQEDVAQLYGIAPYYGRFTSNELPLPAQGLEGVGVRFTSPQEQSVAADVSFDGKTWIPLPNNKFANPNSWSELKEGATNAQFRLSLLTAGAEVSNVEFDLIEDDVVVPKVSAIEIVATAHGAVISFKTDEQATARVEFTSAGSTVTAHPDSPASAVDHSVRTIGSLPAGSSITFKIIVEDLYGNMGTENGQFDTKDFCLTKGFEICGNKVDDDCNGFTDEEDPSGCFNEMDVVRPTLVEFPRHDSTGYICETGMPSSVLSGVVLNDQRFKEHNGQVNEPDCNDGGSRVVKGRTVIVDLNIPEGPAFILSCDTFQTWKESDANPRAYEMRWSFDTDGFTAEKTFQPTKFYQHRYHLVIPPAGAKKIRFTVAGLGHIAYLNGAGTLSLRKEAQRSLKLGDNDNIGIYFDWNDGKMPAGAATDRDPLSTELNSLSFAQIKARALRNPSLKGYVSRLLGGWGSASATWSPGKSVSNGLNRDLVDALQKQVFACLWFAAEDDDKEANAEKASAMCAAAVKSVSKIAGYSDVNVDNGDWGFGRNEGNKQFSAHSSGGQTSILGNGEMLLGFAQAVDMLWPFLSVGQRLQSLETLERELLYMLHRMSIEGRHNAQTWWHYEAISNNWGTVAGGGMLTAAIVLQKFSPYAEIGVERSCWLNRISMAKMSPFMAFADEVMDDRAKLYPQYKRADGVAWESHGYTGYPFTVLVPSTLAHIRGWNKPLAQCLDPVTFQGGKLSNTVEYFAYTTHPTRFATTAFDDYYGGAHGGSVITAAWLLGMAHLLAAQGNLHQAGIHVEHWERMYGADKQLEWTWTSGGNMFQLVNTILFHPGAAAPRVSYEEAKWPGTRLFQYGKAVSRTGWGNVSDTMLTTQAGEVGAHSHADQGTFFFTDFGLTLIMEGRKGSESTSHSIVTIDDTKQEMGNGWHRRAVTRLRSSQHIDVIFIDSKDAYEEGFVEKHHRVFVLVKRPSADCASPLVVFDSVAGKADSQHTFTSRFYSDEKHVPTQETNGDFSFNLVADKSKFRDDQFSTRVVDVDLLMFGTHGHENSKVTKDALEFTVSGQSEAVFAHAFLAKMSDSELPNKCYGVKKSSTQSDDVAGFDFPGFEHSTYLNSKHDGAMTTLAPGVQSNALVVVASSKMSQATTLFMNGTSLSLDSGAVRQVTLSRVSSIAVEVGVHSTDAVRIHVGVDEDYAHLESAITASVTFASGVVPAGATLTLRRDFAQDIDVQFGDNKLTFESPTGASHTYQLFTSMPPAITTTTVLSGPKATTVPPKATAAGGGTLPPQGTTDGGATQQPKLYEPVVGCTLGNLLCDCKADQTCNSDHECRKTPRFANGLCLQSDEAAQECVGELGCACTPTKSCTGTLACVRIDDYLLCAQRASSQPPSTVASGARFALSTLLAATALLMIAA